MDRTEGRLIQPADIRPGMDISNLPAINGSLGVARKKGLLTHVREVSFYGKEAHNHSCRGAAHVNRDQCWAGFAYRY